MSSIRSIFQFCIIIKAKLNSVLVKEQKEATFNHIHSFIHSVSQYIYIKVTVLETEQLVKQTTEGATYLCTQSLFQRQIQRHLKV